MNLLLKNIILALLSSLLCIITMGCDEHKKPLTEDAKSQNPTASSLQAIKNRGELRVGVLADKPPFSAIDRRNKTKGFDIELGKRLAKDLLGDENRIKFILTEPKDRLAVLNDDKVDIMLANLTISSQHINRVDFSQPYLKFYIGIVSPKKAPITDLTQLENKVLIVAKGSATEYYFIRYHPQIKLQTYDYNKEAFNALVSKKGAAFASNSMQLNAWLKNNSTDYVLSIPQIGKETLIAPAVKKGNYDVLRWLNIEMRNLKNEDFFHKTYDKTILSTYGNIVDPNTVIVGNTAN